MTYGVPGVRRLDDAGLNAATHRAAAIRRASVRARAQMTRLDRLTETELDALYRAALADIQAVLRLQANADNLVTLDALQAVLQQAAGRLATLSAARDDLLNTHLHIAAEYGAAPFAAAGVVSAPPPSAAEAVRFVRNFLAEDGLQLSDRLWRVDEGAREVVAGAINRGVIEGQSASRAVHDLLLRGEPVPGALAAKLRAGDATTIGRVIGRDLMTGEGNPRANALRVLRTEINRAHGEAYQAAAFTDPDVIGTRFLLSPSHPRVDICDMHARANVYGLGPGVYPKGRNPWPAHPNTLSFTEAVYADEVTAADRAGKVTRVAWLAEQPHHALVGILGGVQKAAAFRRGWITTNGQLKTPWRLLKTQLRRRGHNVESLS